MKKYIILTLVLSLFGRIWAQETYKSYVDKGNLSLINQDYSQAMNCFEAALLFEDLSSSDIAWAASMVGICAEQLQLDSLSAKYYLMAIENGFDQWVVYEKLLSIAKLKNDVLLSGKVMLIAANKFPERKIKFLRDLLNLYLNHLKFELVLPIADMVLSENQEDELALYAKGVALLNTGCEKAGIGILSEILVKKPEDLLVLQCLGKYYFNKANNLYNKAKNDYNSLKSPTYIEYVAYKDNITLSWNDFRHAISYFEKAYQIIPNVTIKQALYISYSRIDQPINAAKYKNSQVSH